MKQSIEIEALLGLFVSYIVLISVFMYAQGQSIHNDSFTNQTQSQITPFTIPRSSDTTQDDSSEPSSPTTSIIETNEADIILLSERYNQEQFGDSIIGEVENNGTSTADFVQVSVSFYDVNGQIVGREFT